MTPIEVVAAVRIWHRQVWICRRLHDGDSSHNAASFAGSWEFPGGKVEATDATLGAALKREMLEEFDARIVVRELLASIDADHLGKRYRVHFFRVVFVQTPALKVHSETRWMMPEDAAALPHLPSGVEFLRRLQAGEIVV